LVQFIRLWRDLSSASKGAIGPRFGFAFPAAKQLGIDPQTTGGFTDSITVVVDQANRVSLEFLIINASFLWHGGHLLSLSYHP
jgi:hypothetical protein